MKRSEYIRTRQGQKNERWNRRFKKLWLSDINQEPKSKNSIRKEEKLEFQQTVVKDLEERKRRAYRSPVILEIDFYSNQDNPPAIYTLAKNYLDLLENPIPELKTGRSKLVYQNDRLIKFLIVNYHLGMPEFGPRISARIDTIANVVQDLALAERIQRNDFEEYADSTYGGYGSSSSHSSMSIEKHWEEDFFYGRNAISELKKHKSDKKQIIERFGKDHYDGQRNWLLFEAQEQFLKTSAFSLDKLVMAFAGKTREYKYSNWSELLQMMGKQSRDIAINVPLNLQLLHAPQQKGEKAVFKQAVKKALAEFKEKFPVLFPLRTMVGVSILYMPPKPPKWQEVDLDNLARYIIPFVNEIIMPPSNLFSLYGKEGSGDKDWRKLFLGNRENIAKIPEHSITSYQVIQIPRYDDDPEEGFVRLAFHNGLLGNTLWRDLDSFIEKWEETID